MIVSLMKKKFVDEYHWIEEDEMLDLIAIAQSAPFLILTVLSFLYERFRSNLLLSQLLAGMQAGVGAVIASVVWDMGTDAVRQKIPCR